VDGRISSKATIARDCQTFGGPEPDYMQGRANHHVASIFIVFLLVAHGFRLCCKVSEDGPHLLALPGLVIEGDRMDGKRVLPVSSRMCSACIIEQKSQAFPKAVPLLSNA
jgi:hypothetical protein